MQEVLHSIGPCSHRGPKALDDHPGAQFCGSDFPVTGPQHAKYRGGSTNGGAAGLYPDER